jgi:general secretion pathway protein E
MQEMEEIDDEQLAQLSELVPETEDLMDSADDAPIIRLINATLTEAIKEKASDIHIEPFEERLRIRFRVDGMLREVLTLQKALASLVVSRVKVMAKLDIAEKRLAARRTNFIKNCRTCD